MKHGYLSQYFESVVAKRLSAVETNSRVSNQHEFNGTKPLRRILGETADKLHFPAIFLWFGNENEGVACEGVVTWYDSRPNKPHRSSEYRLYFPTTDVSLLAREGDMMFIAKRTDGSLMIIVTANGSTIENQLFWLFGLENPAGSLFELSLIAEKAICRLTLLYGLFLMNWV